MTATSFDDRDSRTICYECCPRGCTSRASAGWAQLHRAPCSCYRGLLLEARLIDLLSRKTISQRSYEANFDPTWLAMGSTSHSIDVPVSKLLSGPNGEHAEP